MDANDTHPASSPTAGAGCSRSVICLSGTWSGTYSGAYHGSFTLNWKQSGSSLSGTIELSNPHSEPHGSGQRPPDRRAPLGAG